MLDVVADWCGPCKIMDKTTFADAGVVAWAKKSVVPARVDAEKGEGRKISARYQAYSFPTVVFLDGDGHEIDRLVGAYQAADFQRGGEAVLGGKTPLLEGLARLKAKWDREEGIRLGGALALRRDLARLRPIALRVVSEEGELSAAGGLPALRPARRHRDARRRLFARDRRPHRHVPPAPRHRSAPRLLRGGVHHGARQARRRRDGPLRRRRDARRRRRGRALTTPTSSPRSAAPRRRPATRPRLSRRTSARPTPPRRTGPRRACASSASSTSWRRAPPRVARPTRRRPGPPRSSWAPERWTRPSRRAPRAPRSRSRTPAEAVKHARRAVELTQGEDAPAQAALAQALRASGDAAGSSAAWKRAAELDPQNAEYRAGAAVRKTGAKKKAAKAS